MHSYMQDGPLHDALPDLTASAAWVTMTLRIGEPGSGRGSEIRPADQLIMLANMPGS